MIATLLGQLATPEGRSKLKPGRGGTGNWLGPRCDARIVLREARLAGASIQVDYAALDRVAVISYYE